MPRNIVLLCLDAVRKDVFDRVATRLLERADISYDQCRSVSSWSVPSHAGIFTGKLPNESGIHTGNCDFSSLSKCNTFLDGIPEHRTFGVSANAWVGSEFGFDGMFERFFDISDTRYFPRGLDLTTFEFENSGVKRYLEFIDAARHSNYPARSLINGIISKIDGGVNNRPLPKPIDYGAKPLSRKSKQLSSGCEEPFFLFANFMEAHDPHQHVLGYPDHDVPWSWHSSVLDPERINVSNAAGEYENEITQFRRLYEAAVKYLDRVIDDLISTISEKTVNETTFIITADHGENLCYESEDRLIGHKGSLSEGLLHVPLLVINAPGTVDNTDQLVSHLDLSDLIVGLANGEVVDISRQTVPAELIGMGFDTYDLDESERRYWDRIQRCVYEGVDKFFWDSLGTTRRYKVGNNASTEELLETGVLIQQTHRDLFSVPYDVLDQAKTDLSTDVDVSVPTEQRLHDLGYL